MKWVLAVGVLVLSGLSGFHVRERGQAQTKELIEAPSATLKARPLYAKSHALIIGIDRYPHFPATLQLHFADQDAGDVADILQQSYGFSDVTRLNDQAATKQGIRDALAKLAGSNVGPDDRVLIYFSGHGQMVKMPQGYQMGFLVPSDADIDFKTQDDPAAYLKSCLSMDEFEDAMSRIPAKHVAVVADACFSGRLAMSGSLTHGGDGEKPIDQVQARGLLQLPVHEVLAASASSQVSLEDPTLGHGIFTYYLLKELKARASTGQVFSLLDLFFALSRSVSKATEESRVPQYPQYTRFNSEGQFLFCSSHELTAGDEGTSGQTAKIKPLGLEKVADLDNRTPVLSMSFSPDHKMLAVNGFDYSLNLFDVATGKGTPFAAKPNTMIRITPDWSKVFTVTITSDEKGSHAVIRALDRTNGKRLDGWQLDLKPGATLEDFCAGNHHVVLCGTYGTGMDRKGYGVYYRIGDKEDHIFSPDFPVTRCATSADGSIIAFAAEPAQESAKAYLILFYPPSSQLHSYTLPDCNACTDLKVSGDGTMLAATCAQRQENGAVIVRNAKVYALGDHQLRLLGNYGLRNVTGFFNGGSQIFGWSTPIGGTYVDLFDTDSGKALAESPGSPMWPSDDGALVAQAGSDGRVTVFRMTP